ncbi:hypothetical protein ABC766_30260 [Methylobacterium fujisawaense]|uniref:hypothetical protein n=1 Tax=Methylobacterium fujisawaense TaxID=107400 RepID=UPI0031F5CC45
MSAGFGPYLAELADGLARAPGASVTETATHWRLDGAASADAAALARIAEAARLATVEGCGSLRVYAEVAGEVDPAACSPEDVAEETLTLVLAKFREPGWCYFLTVAGFEGALDDAFAAAPCAVWVAMDFAPFATATLSVTPWGGPKEPPAPGERTERPRKYVRDLTHGHTPSEVGPWLPTGPLPADSAVFAAWRGKAADRLAACLPSEIRPFEDGLAVVLKGPRSSPVPVAPAPAGWAAGALPALAEAAGWVYGQPRETEARFQFLNNHLSIGWREGETWPIGLAGALPGGLASAREAYAFHLQDQSKDALKTLGDLRKALQDEVARAQTATRDLLSALWRDLGVAGIVLALRSPAAAQIASAPTLRWVTLATAVVLVVSLVVTVLANRRFNRLADEGRAQWRGRLYAFLPDAEWDRLVEGPIRDGRRAYHGALPFIILLYGAAVLYLLVLSVPSPSPPPQADTASSSGAMPPYRAFRVPYRMPGSMP